jgi:hypothetical protein
VSELGKRCIVPVEQRLFGSGGRRSSSCCFRFLWLPDFTGPGGNWGLDVSKERCCEIESLGGSG